MKYLLTGILIFAFSQSLHAQVNADDFLQKLLIEKGSSLLLNILDKPDSFRYQIIYTQISRSKHNKPTFTSYYLHVDKEQYFNPASTVKLPIALLALEKLHKLHVPMVDKYTTMLLDSSYNKQTDAWIDSTSENKLPSIAHYVRKIFLISDNEAYNRLYEFDGQQYINETLQKKGYKNTVITRSFAQMNEDENRHTSQVRFVNGDHLLYTQPAAYSSFKFDFSKQIKIGNGHLDRNDSLIKAPMDFTAHNKFALADMQQMLQAVLFPSSVNSAKRFDLSEDDYRFLYKYMSQYPSETSSPKYDTTEYIDSYTKFFFFKAGKQKIPPYIRVFNKAGWSYGFLTDAAYIVDFLNGVEFMLTATIYTNSDGILNDDKYDYDTIGYPFFEEVGRIIYNYELQRQRKNAPDLSRFVIQYDK
ncbi:serine hydrolase [Pinibacter soli]|uniref:Serine hydrolase n=1 Tax=Pinibacter soli TaxID=3044211 RepID=A0ABT6RGN7_9BACT|nr:serine hydrolase [Pinibacter soli]MDI3321728.1 serine hydrolase [Pinibacter soli]